MSAAHCRSTHEPETRPVGVCALVDSAKAKLVSSALRVNQLGYLAIDAHHALSEGMRFFRDA